jgi:hypothetical protein
VHSPAIAETQSEPEAGVERKPARGFLRTDQHWVVEVPIWIPGFRGEFAYGDVSLEGEDGQDLLPVNPIEPEPEDPPGNIFSRLFSSSTYLKFFFMGRAEFSHGKVRANIDAFTGHVGDSVEFRYNGREIVQANFHSTLARTFVSYEVATWRPALGRSRLSLEPYLGARAHFFSIDSDLNHRVNRLDLTHSWGEALLGLTIRQAWTRWLIVLQGDWGNSFSVDSNSYWMSAAAFWRINGLLALRVGWTDWRVDVTRTVLGERMVLDTHLSGPSMGLTFNF